MGDIYLGINTEILYAENNIDPKIVEERTFNYEKLNDEQKYFCDNALEIMLGDTDAEFLVNLDPHIEHSHCKVIGKRKVSNICSIS